MDHSNQNFQKQYRLPGSYTEMQNDIRHAYM